MKKFSEIKGGWILKNLILAIGAVLIIVLIVNTFLGIITQHGKQIATPDFSGLTVSEARAAAAKEGVRIEVGDSVYVRNMKRGCVFTQNPRPGTMVKKGRRILLTTNAVGIKKVTMPSLVGCSLRQAKAELNSKGLFLGRLIYVNDIATNNVLRQLYRNREIKGGKTIDSGSTIDLVLGLSGEEGQAFAPNVIGMRYMRAVDAIQSSSLNIARLVFDETVRNYSDSISAIVYNQRPSASDIPLAKGSEVTIYLSTDTSKVPVKE